jgi:hypothetical protein
MFGVFVPLENLDKINSDKPFQKNMQEVQQMNLGSLNIIKH